MPERDPFQHLRNFADNVVQFATNDRPISLLPDNFDQDFSYKQAYGNLRDTLTEATEYLKIAFPDRLPPNDTVSYIVDINSMRDIERRDRLTQQLRPITATSFIKQPENLYLSIEKFRSDEPKFTFYAKAQTESSPKNILTTIDFNKGQNTFSYKGRLVQDQGEVGINDVYRRFRTLLTVPQYNIPTRRRAEPYLRNPF